MTKLRPCSLDLHKEHCRIHVCALLLNKSLFRILRCPAFQKLILQNTSPLQRTSWDKQPFFVVHYQLGWRSLDKRPLPRHKALESKSAWHPVHLEKPMQCIESSLKLVNQILMHYSRRGLFKFSHSFPCHCKYTMLCYSCCMHLLMHH